MLNRYNRRPSHYSPDPRMIFSGIFVSCLVEVCPAIREATRSHLHLVRRWLRRILIRSMLRFRHLEVDIGRG